MNVNELVGWYQNRISKYDRNKSESFVQNKKINAYLRPTKQKTELIDVDLVRGSSFAKAKTKQTLLTVIILAGARLLLLPAYSKWWVEQTSQNIYKFLFTLYVLQVVNFGLYIIIINFNHKNVLSIRDLVIPNLLSLLLSVIHSQIVATACSNRRDSKPQFMNGRKRRLSKRRSSRPNPMIPNICRTPKSTPDEFSTECVSRTPSLNQTNCPNGLRKRNADWNHIYSPYWLNKSGTVSNVQLERNSNYDGAITGSERSNVDHGFESFNGKTSSSEEPQSSPINGSTKETTSDKENVLSGGEKEEAGVNSLSPITSRLHIPTNTVFASPWAGVTSNSECSYSSGSEYDSTSEESESKISFPLSDSLKTSGASDKISCTLWCYNKMTKVEMSVADISTAITSKVETMSSSCEYIYIGLLLSVLLSSVPPLCRICESVLDSTSNDITIQSLPFILKEKITQVSLAEIAFGETFTERLMLYNALFLRFGLTSLFFFMLTVAERTFKERLLYAKLFSHLTSSRRSKKSEVPHFRLSKLRNIKTWLSVRSYLRRRGPQRSVDVIVSATLMLSLIFVSFLCAESLNDSVQQHWQYDLEVFMWSCSLGCFILRFMTLGTAINTKYRSVSILITEQINLYLKMEQHPQKKENFTAANNVLKLAADLLKEIESPFKISGFNINPYLSAVIRVLIVSALSGVCSDMLGFKLKLFKLKES